MKFFTDITATSKNSTDPFREKSGDHQRVQTSFKKILLHSCGNNVTWHFFNLYGLFYYYLNDYYYYARKLRLHINRVIVVSLLHTSVMSDETATEEKMESMFTRSMKIAGVVTVYWFVLFIIIIIIMIHS